MLEKRIIPALLLLDGGFVKTTKMQSPKYIGDPTNTVRIFNDKQADELFIIDIGASKQNTPPDFSLLSELASEAFMPLGYAGGIKTIHDMEKIFSLGFEKVGIASALHENPKLITEASKLFGSQSIVAIIDVSKPILGGFKAVNHLNPKQSRPVLDLVQQVENLGAGEITLHFNHLEGTSKGYELDLIKQVSQISRVPIVVLGGAGTKSDLTYGLAAGADAVAAGSLFVYHGPHKAVLLNYPSRKEIESIIRG